MCVPKASYPQICLQISATLQHAYVPVWLHLENACYGHSITECGQVLGTQWKATCLLLAAAFHIALDTFLFLSVFGTFPRRKLKIFIICLSVYLSISVCACVCFHPIVSIFQHWLRVDMKDSLDQVEGSGRTIYIEDGLGDWWVKSAPHRLCVQ